MTGAGRPFRRRIALARPTASSVTGAIEDFMHHFEVFVEHRDGVVTDVTGTAVRAPWSLCPGAAAHLQELVGTPVGVVPRAADPTQHCTHLLDLALLAVRFAGGSAPSRRMDLEASGWEGDELLATARRDDGAVLEWTVQGRTIIGPAPYAGRHLQAGFGSWVGTQLEPDEAELALALRRTVLMSPSRGIDLDDFARLAESGVLRGSCFASQPERIELGRRNRGASLGELPGA